MKLLKIRTLTLAFFVAVCPMMVVASDGKVQAAEEAAADWLALVDANAYEASWNEAAALFRSQVNPSDWSKSVAAARHPLGGVIARKLLDATYATTLPGAPDGEYVVLQFQTDFENKTQAVETVTPMLDEGRWRVSGYYVR